VAAALLTVVTALPAISGTQWHLREGALACGSYFDMEAGQAATERGDMGWLATTSCVPTLSKPEVVILEPKPLHDIATGTWRVRLIFPSGNAMDAYVRAYNILGLPLDPARRKEGQVPYYKVFWPAPTPTTRADPEAFDKALRNLIIDAGTAPR